MKSRVREMRDLWLDEIAENITLSETLEGKARLLTMYRESLHQYYERIEVAEDRVGYIRHLDRYIELSQVGK